MQSSIPITVKWKKEVFENVSVDLSAPVAELKVQLFSLTGVAPEKQKLILGGKNLKDDQSLESSGAKHGSVLQMMGNAAETWVKPDIKVTFVEDLSASQQAAVLSKVPAGLSNLGNTCYMAATMQSLRSVPELTDALKHYHDANSDLTLGFDAFLAASRMRPEFESIKDEPHQVAHVLNSLFPPEQAWLHPMTRAPHDPNKVITAAAGALYKQLDASGEPIEPYAFHSALQRRFPQFGERGERGGLMQQDADECFNSFLTAAGTQLPGGLVENLFGIRQQITLTNAETDAEPPATQYEQTLNLSCHIEEKDPCSSLTVGLINSTRGSLEKLSTLIGRNCVYNRSMKIANLPPFLAVKFVRFQYDSATQKKKKILRQVSYPANLDVSPLVTDHLRSIIEQKRRKISEQEDKRKQVLLSVAPADSAADAVGAEEPDEADALCSPTGMYELVGLVCHKVHFDHFWCCIFFFSCCFFEGACGRLRALHWVRKGS
jgi:ubiquitin carboxyl-terminal hydrolase 14